MLLQVAIGPVFFYLVNVAIQQDLSAAFAAVIAVTLVDYIYISLAVLGVGRILNNDRWKKVFGNISAVVLIGFGIFMLKGAFDRLQVSASIQDPGIVKTFLSVFFLTISSPVTIIFWMGVFASKSIELDLSRRQTVLFGVGSGFSTLVFLGIVVILVNLLQKSIPFMAAVYANLVIGVVIISYGFLRIWKINKFSLKPVST